MVIRACDMDTALRLFQEGKSRADIGKALGKDRKQAAKILARAIRAKGVRNGNN